MTENAAKQSLYEELGCAYIAGARLGRLIIFGGASLVVGALLMSVVTPMMSTAVGGEPEAVVPGLNWLLWGASVLGLVLILAGAFIDFFIAPSAAESVIRKLEAKYPDGPPPQG